MQDNWTIGPRLTLNLGVRHERVKSEATGGIIGVDTNTTVPRLAATYDLFGNGGTVLQASFAHYAGKYSEAQIGRNSPVGNPAVVLYDYTGPAGAGRDFAPGFDLANYDVVFGSFPTANIFLDERPVVADHAGVQRVGRPSARTARHGEADLHQPVGTTTSSRTSSTTRRRRAAPMSPTSGIDFGTFDNIVYRNSDAAGAELPGAAAAGELPPVDAAVARRALDGAAEERGQLRGRGAEPAGDQLVDRRLPGDPRRRRATSRSGG